MLKTCPICGKIHDINKICKRPSRKKDNDTNKFRDSYQWKQKRKQIRERDHYLCQICLKDKDNVQFKYNYQEIEVHHIIPIEEDYSKRLDSTNLITLCRYHHEEAESGNIEREELQKIVAEKYNPPHPK